MYAGRIVEYGKTEDILQRPQHPYTIGLMGAMPELNDDIENKRLKQIEGSPPDLLNLPPGCSFFDRCDVAMSVCREAFPKATINGEHIVRCFQREAEQHELN